jgi:hypothetical protein
MLGHRRSQCKNPPSGEKVKRFIKPSVPREVKRVEPTAVVELPPPAEEVVEVEEESTTCKWCCETTHVSKLCRRYKTRLCPQEDCFDQDCPYAHSASELRETIWFHTEMCSYNTHTSECRRAFAHSEDEKYNALSALIATRMSAELFI